MLKQKQIDEIRKAVVDQITTTAEALHLKRHVLNLIEHIEHANCFSTLQLKQKDKKIKQLETEKSALMEMIDAKKNLENIMRFIGSGKKGNCNLSEVSALEKEITRLNGAISEKDQIIKIIKGRLDQKDEKNKRLNIALDANANWFKNMLYEKEVESFNQHNTEQGLKLQIENLNKELNRITGKEL